MSIPNLKRVKITSPDELAIWFAKNHAQTECVMLVTYADASHAKHVSRERVDQALEQHRWISERRYTLNPTLLGHVISKLPDAKSV